MQYAVPVREALVTALQETPDLVPGLIPQGSVYGERVPTGRTFPFIRIGPPRATPVRASCWNGEAIAIDVSAFVKGLTMDDAGTVGAVVKQRLDGAMLDMGDETTASVQWTGGQIFADPEEPDAWHSLNSFVVT